MIIQNTYQGRTGSNRKGGKEPHDTVRSPTRRGRATATKLHHHLKRMLFFLVLLLLLAAQRGGGAARPRDVIQALDLDGVAAAGGADSEQVRFRIVLLILLHFFFLLLLIIVVVISSSSSSSSPLANPPPPPPPPIFSPRRSKLSPRLISCFFLLFPSFPLSNFV